MEWKAAVGPPSTGNSRAWPHQCPHSYKEAPLPSRRARCWSSKTQADRQVRDRFGSHNRTQQRPRCSVASQETPGVQKPLPQGRCYGCGIQLQTDAPEAAGYVPPDKFALKQKHRQLDQLLCGRCQQLSNGAMVAAVEDFSQRYSAPTDSVPAGGRRLVSPEELRRQLAVVKDSRAIAVLLVDLLDASGSFLSRVRDLVGNNPVILVGTKADLLPAGTFEEDVKAWLVDTAAFKQLTTVSTHLVSSRTGAGVSEAAAGILRERRGRDVYMLGAANVGKSAFVRALIREMSRMTSIHFDAAAIVTGKHLPVESAMPGTTLSMIPLRTFASGGELFDTPGVHLHHRLPHMLTPDELKEVHPRRRLRPYVAPPLQPANGSPRASGTYVWGALIRLDVIDAPPGAQLVFYGPPALQVHSLPLGSTLAGTSQLPEHQGHEEASFGSRSVAARGGLQVAKEAVIKAPEGAGPAADIAISGLSGWVAVHLPTRGARLSIRAWAPVGVEVCVRPPLPVPNPVKPLVRPAS